MNAPMLIPAYPALLRAGLPVRVKWGAGDGDVGPERVLCSVEESPTDGEVWCNIASTRNVPSVDDYPLSELRLDLRDPAARDASVRALWRKVHPEAVPLTAPAFYWYPFVEGTKACWILEHPEGSPAVRCQDRSPMYEPAQVIPALASIPLDSPDRDMLALACVLAAVLP